MPNLPALAWFGKSYPTTVCMLEPDVMSALDRGYKGRHGSYELMTINNEIRKQIVKSPDSVVLRRIGV